MSDDTFFLKPTRNTGRRGSSRNKHHLLLLSCFKVFNKPAAPLKVGQSKEHTVTAAVCLLPLFSFPYIAGGDKLQDLL